MEPTGDFYEDDEDPKEIHSAFDDGDIRYTERPQGFSIKGATFSSEVAYQRRAGEEGVWIVKGQQVAFA